MYLINLGTVPILSKPESTVTDAADAKPTLLNAQHIVAGDVHAKG